ncbi:hypothetical protein [Moorena sp. SIO3A2]|uniref:hypothetical protein n=1 Tax=Moorena sp. SIO3A2 TaxID=2607841 RepID=UPI0013B8A173|nr:hypothetical protein [Moorena sp. SIO3A2]NER90354.1 hypothetical protein [Moorena sp. SIO3A2]
MAPFSTTISTIINVEFNVQAPIWDTDELGNVIGRDRKVVIPFSLRPPTGRRDSQQFGSTGVQLVRARCLTEDGYLPEFINVGHSGYTFFNNRGADVTVQEISNTSFDGVLVKVLGQPIVLELKWRSYYGSSS